MSADGFRDELETLINKHSMENGSGTPDFILARYLAQCLASFDEALLARETWYGRTLNGEPLRGGEATANAPVPRG